jgi:hypothetical protein
MPPSPGIPTGRGSGLKHRPVWVRIPPGAHNADMKFRSKTAAAMCGVVLALGVVGCSSAVDVAQTSDLGNQFEQANPTDDFLDDGSGNELEVGTDLALPSNWPQAIPTPEGSLIAISVIDERTAVATWTVQNDVFLAQKDFLTEFDKSFAVEPLLDLSTESIIVYGAIGNGFDVTISATLGAKADDPGEITVLVNPSS